MALYRFLSLLFPRSYNAKLAFLALVGAYAPLILFSVWPAGGSGVIWQDRALALRVAAGSGMGAAVLLVALWLVMKPLRMIEGSMAAYVADRSIRPLPAGYRDEIGRLMTSVNRLVADMDTEIDAATRAAETDALTGLENRRGFDRRVPREVVGSVIYFDIDHFKEINDCFGHSGGDAVLGRIAEEVSAGLRTRDVFARFGGEEFAIYLDEVVEARALVVAERLRLRVRERIVMGGRSVTVSVGVATRADPVSREALVSAADRAVYVAKNAGRDVVATEDGPSQVKVTGWG